MEISTGLIGQFYIYIKTQIDIKYKSMYCVIDHNIFC